MDNTLTAIAALLQSGACLTLFLVALLVGAVILATVDRPLADLPDALPLPDADLTPLSVLGNYPLDSKTKRTAELPTHWMLGDDGEIVALPADTANPSSHFFDN